MFATAFLDIPPLTGVSGTVVLPGSKSISNRVLLLAALSAGTTTLHDLLDSDDTRVMLGALRALGCGVRPSGSSVEIDGLGGQLIRKEAKLFMGNAGTAIRPLTAALAILGGDFELRGVPRMHERPIGDLVDALLQIGCHIDYLGTEGFPPLHIGQPSLRLDAPIRVRGNVSSQFLTALLMALPLAAATQDIVIEVVGELISRPYIEITLNLLARFNVRVVRDGWQRFTIPAGSRFQSPGTLHVEADASSASYFIAAGAIATVARGQKDLRIEGVGVDSIQGDIRFIEAAQMMGAEVHSGPNWLQVSCGSWPLRAIDLDCNHIPDAAMTLAVMALYAQGTTTLRNIASWRVKETDRIAAMASELRKLGASVDEGADFIRVTPPATPADWQAASIRTYDDHRMAMCFSLAAFNPAGLPVRIIDPKCVAKTFPDFFEALFALAQTAPNAIPVICVDGPTASGKGTLAGAVAKMLGYHLLDSGSLYRITALAALQAGLALEPANEAAIANLIPGLAIRFSQDQIFLNGLEVSEAIRTEEAGMNASKVSVLPQIRQALIELQHSFRQLPGLVADGRDMGTVIFPDAALKVYLTASADKRAQRRYKQLISKGISATLLALRADLEARDARDTSRSVAPLRPAQDAQLLDNSDLTVEESVDLMLDWWQSKQPFRAI
ncbi:MAG: bifunctional 3-phosphoshikimate 1-carboxyvinyltransferase/cytidylate kinase [Gammaproteobacteria bacterium]|uniref:bifunctional 3-phosphoshikimate 1-carboxyvinyltransferase/cytidylate kinase n=1 Tax=Rhodoferax sp. TaxID=50421 RepID=UPI0017D97CA5|nr:bifunctional 3-phosphoshikimate 1-carboxyvinyltransferase/cytidylate kinase [Rhodoferax sp.]MBU3898758.1 bifunctional 3-phosphoshikimate 1-carboxyvinyltransferase/cytidylate kinase [Gammaproteobacteria bacterium]MBA3059197.1 bifunctional 3-phosphoshikimate 1-carboxyvinyltransferase/cytidylate kinase [Rhodoferax sp.]MBU3996552.1 bifunctional 3-phosphoshikimate 1-carboxyvinyltransferase/cytidylate kinase [Gammaproteobacteria bacterium]MBU4017807.1 bifunctional 3-phosphoshikimate 1-carboxyvinyl